MNAVPKLRFPEFDGEWKRNRIDEIGALKSGIGFPEKEQGGLDGIPFYKVSDMNIPENSQVMVSANNYVTDEQVKRLKYKPIVSNSIIFAKVGAAIFLDRKRQAANFLLDNNMMAFLPSSKIDFNFIYQVFLQINLAKFAQVGALPSYNASDIGIIKTHIPSLPEQQKIASFLSSVDKKIDLLRQKKDALETYKKGLMQKIFSQEIRFKQDDGSDFTDWEEVALGNVAQITTGTGNREDSSVSGQYIFFDRSTDVRWSDTYEFEEEAIIVAGEGKSFPPRYFFGKFGLHQRSYAIHQFNGVIARFLFYVISLRQSFFLKMSVGSTMPSLRMNAFTDFPICLPCSAEQQKIANLFSALDTKIQNTSSQIEQMEAFKKGLLQQMFV